MLKSLISFLLSLTRESFSLPPSPHSCPVDQTVIFHELNPNYVSLDPQEDGDLKRFSFEVHWTRETFGLHTFVSCKLSLCSKDYNTADEEKGIPVVSNDQIANEIVKRWIHLKWNAQDACLHHLEFAK